MARLFIALPVEEEVKEQVSPILNELALERKTIKVVSPDHLHITVKFIGDFDEGRLDELVSTFNEIDYSKKPVDFTISGIGTFPPKGKPAVIWCGLDTDLKLMKSLKNEIESFTTPFEIEKENRPFKPHLTLGRVRRNSSIPPHIQKMIDENRNTHFGTSSFKRLILFKSQLTGDGPIYTELAKLEFTGE